MKRSGAETSKGEAKKTIVLLHGAYNTPWCWNLVSARLRAEGFLVLTPRLDSDKADTCMEDHVDKVASEIAKRSEVYGVAHSRFADVGLRLASRGLLRQLTLVAGGVREAADQVSMEISDPARKYAPGYLEAIHPMGDLSCVDQLYARDIFYNDCRREFWQPAIRRLRPQNRQDGSPALASQPDVPITYISCQRDNTLNHEWQMANTGILLPTAAIVEMNTGHFPFLSQPEQFTQRAVAATKAA